MKYLEKFHSNVYEVKTVCQFTKMIALSFSVSELLLFDYFFPHYPYMCHNYVTIWNI